mgnify:CR=1 FL=1
MKDFISFFAGVLAALIFATAQLGELQAAQGGKLAQANQVPDVAVMEQRVAQR